MVKDKVRWGDIGDRKSLKTGKRKTIEKANEFMQKER